MKKIAKIFCTAVFALTAFAFTSCADAIVNDGSNVRSYIDTSKIGASGGAIPFSMFKGCDIQIWENTFTAATTTEGLVITIGSVGWFGGAFVNNGAAAASDAITYDMSKVSKITFEAKASKNDKFTANAGSDSSTKAHDTKVCEVTTEWQTFTIDVANATSTDYAIFVFSGDGGTLGNGDTLTIRDIAYFNASGEEIVPTENN